MKKLKPHAEFLVLEPEWSSREAWKKFIRERKGKQNFMEWIWEKKIKEDHAE